MDFEVVALGILPVLLTIDTHDADPSIGEIAEGALKLWSGSPIHDDHLIDFR